MRRERFFVFRDKGLGGVWAGPDCGILGLSSRWFEGFLAVCVGLSVFFCFFFGCRDFSLILWIFSLSWFGGSGVLSHGADS